MHCFPDLILREVPNSLKSFPSQSLAASIAGFLIHYWP